MAFISNSAIDFASLPNPIDKFQLLEVIGEGTFGEVYSAIELDSKDGNSISGL
jgi:serine/threonine protein kinase